MSPFSLASNNLSKNVKSPPAANENSTEEKGIPSITSQG